MTYFDLVIKLYPGLGLAAALVFFGLGVNQYLIFRSRSYLRSRNIANFCFCNAIFALNVAIIHSRAFSFEFAWNFFIWLQWPVYLGLYFYLESISYFVTTPQWLKLIYSRGMLFLAAISNFPLLAYLAFNENLLFDSSQPWVTNNFFVNSYTEQFGRPLSFGLITLSLSSLLTIVATVVLLRRIRSSSKDLFLTAGLLFTLLASVMDHLLLPLTTTYYIPLLFLTNIFEAFRMTYLAAMEDIKKSSNTLEMISPAEPYENQPFTEERLQKLVNKLEGLMKSQKLFLDPNLNLEKLALHLRIPSYQLTQVLRFGLKMQFFEYLSKYRIEEVKNQLNSPEKNNTNILDIAHSCGFNSKSAFNKAFKKHTGTTPSAYRKGSRENHEN